MLLRVSDVAKRLGVGVHTVRKYIRNGELAVADMGTGNHRSVIRINEADLDEFIASRTYDGPDAPAVLDRARRSPRPVDDDLVS